MVNDSWGCIYFYSYFSSNSSSLKTILSFLIRSSYSYPIYISSVISIISFYLSSCIYYYSCFYYYSCYYYCSYIYAIFNFSFYIYKFLLCSYRSTVYFLVGYISSSSSKPSLLARILIEFVKFNISSSVIKSKRSPSLNISFLNSMRIYRILFMVFVY